MKDILFIALVLAAWFVMLKFVLPKFGVPT